jgi:hypothetical protein
MPFGHTAGTIGFCGSPLPDQAIQQAKKRLVF